jgi:hypothetical protein
MSNLKVNTINDASGGSNAVLYGVAAPANSMGFRNRLINSDMRIDQRNAGAAVTNASGVILDRWADFKAGSGQYTAQQSTTAPTGFTNSFQHTVTNAVTPAASDIYQITQAIEGFNTADLGFGTANAQSVTLSFWVRSSITGSWAASLSNGISSGRRSYVATYTISVANTWEYKTITIPGDTAGTWATNNTAGIAVHFDQGSGSNHNATAGVWTASSGTSEGRRTSGTVNLIGTAGATFYITGVQLEAGSVASPFERRDYGRELIMCQRYYQILAGYFAITEPGRDDRTTGSPSLKASMRSSPTVTFSSGANFHRPAIAFYNVTAIVAGGSAEGTGYVTVDIASGAGTTTSGQLSGLLYSAEL